jgi:hypothetical protein
MDTERAYFTSVPAASIGSAVSDYFRSKGYETQVFDTSDGQTLVQLRKQNAVRAVLGISYALTVIVTQGDGCVSVRLGGHEWIDTALSAGASLIVPPVLIGTVYGAWRELRLNDEAFDAVERALSGAAAQVA